jgi:hypothetical protein
MGVREVQKEFNLTYPELEEVAWSLCDHLSRDLSDLNIFGLTTGVIGDLSSICNAFSDLKTDEENPYPLLILTGKHFLLN